MARLAGYGGSVLTGRQVIHACDVAWDELVDVDVTLTLDGTDYKVGSGSNKMVQAAGLAVGDILATDNIAALDLNTPGYTHLFCWAKSSVLTALGDYRILLDNHAQCVSPDAQFNLPILEAGVWKFCQLPLVAGAWADLAAVISVGLKLQANDPGAATIWLDHIEAAKKVSGIRGWTLDEILDVVDVTSFADSGHKAFVATVRGWSGSFEGYKDGAPLEAGSVVSLELRESETGTQQWRGSAIITGRHSQVTVDGAVTYTYDFQGTHALEAPTT